MNTDNRPFIKWFGYTRRERRSSFILFILLIILIALRYLIPSKEIAVENLTGLLALADSGKTGFSNSSADTSHLFKFDPNLASYDTLILLGLSEKQARTLINFRNRGGLFRIKTDIRKIYGIDEQTAESIMPFIVFEIDPGGIKKRPSDSLTGQKKLDRLDLNRCDSAALDRMPGIGPVLASRIIKFRKLLGGFASAEQLKEVYGLSEASYISISGRVFADSSVINRIKINEVGIRDLSLHPYLNRYEIMAIIKYKELKGRISNTTELIENKVLTADKARKISPYLKF